MPKVTGPEPLQAAQLRPSISAKDFGFETTESLPNFEGWLGQDRAVDAIRMGAAIKHKDFHVFVLGTPGSGRRSIARSILTESAANKPRASDWVYVNNFDTPHKPRAIQLPPGVATPLRKAMEGLIDELANDIPALFESEDYQTRRRSIDQVFTDEHEAAMGEVFEKAQERSVAILRTPMGFTFAGIRDGEVLNKEQYEALNKDERKTLETAMQATQENLSDLLKSVPAREKEHRRQIEELNYELASSGVDEAIGDVKAAFPNLEDVQAYLETVRQDLIENAELFLLEANGGEAGPFPVATSKHYALPHFQRYAVNVMVAHDAAETGAPVVEEGLPILANLIGRVEYASEMGALVTNFTMIKPGALHRANGGFLILDARQVLSEPLAWDALKRCLRTKAISIYSPGERMSLVSTVTLDPDPVPLDLRVVLIGERLHYYLLAALDPDFQHLFKLEADFNDHLTLADGAAKGYSQMIATVARQAGLRAMDCAAMEHLFHESVRMTGDGERLSLNIDRLSDILREADFWAEGRNSDTISAPDVDRAIAQGERRAGRVRELGQEAITRDTILIDTEGQRVGQINALSVLQMGGSMFGRPSRLTARTRPGAGKVIDIEREIELGGPIHSKGMLILQGYLAATYATKAPMSLWASLVFEQSYGGIDGDSASAAELITLISSLAEVPIDQSFAITGSVNQFGDIQAIGGANEKIEGFFDVCAARGLSGAQGVLIPAANVRTLSLRQRVIDAVEQGKFRIIPMHRIEDGIEILTGQVAGTRNKDGTFPKGSVNRLVEDRLNSFADIRKSFGKDTNGGGKK